MIQPKDASRLLDERPSVRLFSGADHSQTIAVGRMIAFSDKPMVCVELEDGSRRWWVAEIAEVVR